MTATPAPQPKAFTRSMRITGVLLLTLSAVTPASSVYVIIPGIIQQAGTGAFIAMAAAAVVALCVAFVYAELTSAFPLAGGEYAMLGRALGPAVGFVLMGMTTLSSALAPALLSLGASDYVSAIWPGVRPVPFAVGILAGSALFGVLNIRLNAWVTGLFLAVEVGALAVLTVLGFSHVHRPILELIQHPVMLGAGALRPTPVGLIGLATAVGVFSYNGFGQACYFSEEMHEAPRLVAPTILWALVLTVAFEFIPMTAVLLGAPDLKHLLASTSPFGDFVQTVGGRRLNIVIGLGVALSIINAAIATLLLNARFFFSSGRDQVWHGRANRALIQVHSRFDSPWVATLLAGVTAIAACFIPFNLLLVLTGTTVVVTYALLCIGVIAGRLSGRTAHAGYRMPWFPLAPVIGLAALVYILWADWLDLSVGRPSLIATACMLVGASLYYLVLRRRRGPDWKMVGPAEAPGQG